jgi:transposase
VPVSATGSGLLRASFVPPKPIRTLRNLTRYRKAQIHDRSREAARLHKMLEDAGIKLATVATDIMGKSGRDMRDALVSGTTNPWRDPAGCAAHEDPCPSRSAPRST